MLVLLSHILVRDQWPLEEKFGGPRPCPVFVYFSFFHEAETMILHVLYDLHGVPERPLYSQLGYRGIITDYFEKNKIKTMAAANP